MKKSLFKLIGFCFLAFTMLVISSCKPEVSYETSTDKVLTLGIPDVYGKIFPGVNYVYWNKVANAKNGYDWYVYENGVLKNTQPIHTDKTFIIDTDVNYGVQKHYKVWATGDSAARAIYYQEGKSGSVTLTPIVPDYRIVNSPLELALYENGYEEGKAYSLTQEEANYQLSSESIRLVNNDDGTFTVSFPVKAYLSYEVYADNSKGNQYSVFGNHETLIAAYQDFAVNNRIVSFSGKAITSGDYSVYVKASTINGKYVNGKKEFKANKMVSYDAITLMDSYSAGNISAVYNSNDSVKLSWTPARLSTGEYVPVENYKVYRQASLTAKYEEVTGTISSTYIPGSKLYGVPVYKIEDKAVDGSSYIYTFVITSGTKVAGVASKVAVSSLGSSVINTLNNSVSAEWKDKETVRLVIKPALLSDGSKAKPADYIVCRKVQNENDSAYVEIPETILTSSDANGNSVYFVDNKVADNTVAYIYAVYLKEGDKVQKETVKVSAYTENLYSDLSVSFVSDDSDGIENDVKVVLTVEDGQTIDSVKYMILDATSTTAYLDADYKNVLSIAAADVQENEYTWIIKDVDIDSYVSVSAVVNGKAKRSTTTAKSASEPAESAESENFKVSVNLIEADDDDLINDAIFVITRPTVDAQISARYATGADAETAKANALTGTELTLNGDYVLYYITKQNVIRNKDEYVAVAMTISEPGKKDTVLYDTKQFVYKDTDAVSVSTPVWKENEADKKANDIYFNISGAKKNQTITVVYATAEDKETAKKYLDTSNVRTLVTGLAGYENYEFNSAIYPQLGNLDAGLYFAVGVTVEQINRNPVSGVTVTETSSVDSNVTITTAPVVSASFVNLSDDMKKDDLYVRYEVGINQRVERIYYATVSADEYNDSSSLIDLRIETKEGFTNLNKYNAVELYRTKEKIVYEISKETNFAAGTYVAVKVLVSETGLESNSAVGKAGPVTIVEADPETTAAPVLSREKLYFTATSGDGKYNDIRSDEIKISIDVDQYIKSVKYVSAESVDAAKALFDTTKAKGSYIPTQYDLTTKVIKGVETLTKTYSYLPYISDVSDGNYLVLQLVISQTGYADYVTYLTTKEYTDSYYYGGYGELIDDTYIASATEEISVPAYSSQKAVRTPTFIVSNKDKNGHENELVHVVIYDVVDKDALNHYEYKLERTLEKNYYTSNDDKVNVWETVEDNILLSWNGYDEGVFDKYYKYEDSSSELDNTSKDVKANNTYVYRLTKTRLANYSSSRKDETVTVSRKITPQYYVKSPEIKFETYENRNMKLSVTEAFNLNYEYLDLYDYRIYYNVKYGDYNYSSDQEINGWDWEDISENSDGSLYRLKDAVITDEISRYYGGIDYSSAVVNVYIEKTLKSNYLIKDTEETNLNIIWGIDFTINADPGISITGSEYPGFCLLIPTSGFTNYTWYINDYTLDYYASSYTSDNSAYIYKSDLNLGSNEIFLIAENANGMKYSASMTIVK